MPAYVRLFCALPLRVDALPMINYKEVDYAAEVERLGIPLEDITSYEEWFKLPYFTSKSPIADAVNQEIEDLVHTVIDAILDFLEEQPEAPFGLAADYAVRLTDKTLSVHADVQFGHLQPLPCKTRGTWHYNRETCEPIDIHEVLELNKEPPLYEIDILETLWQYGRKIGAFLGSCGAEFPYEVLQSDLSLAAENLFMYYQDPDNIDVYFAPDSPTLVLKARVVAENYHTAVRPLRLVRNGQLTDDDHGNPAHELLRRALDLKGKRDLLIVELTDHAIPAGEKAPPKSVQPSPYTWLQGILTGDVRFSGNVCRDTFLGDNGFGKLEGPQTCYLVVPRDRYAVVGYQRADEDPDNVYPNPAYCGLMFYNAADPEIDPEIADSTIYLADGEGLTHYNLHDLAKVKKKVDFAVSTADDIGLALAYNDHPDLQPLYDEPIGLVPFVTFKDNGNPQREDAYRRITAMEDDSTIAWYSALAEDRPCLTPVNYQEIYDGEDFLALYTKCWVADFAGSVSSVLYKEYDDLFDSNMLLKTWDLTLNELRDILDESANYRFLYLPSYQGIMPPIGIVPQKLYYTSDGKFAANCRLTLYGRTWIQDVILILPREYE